MEKQKTKYVIKLNDGRELFVNVDLFDGKEDIDIEDLLQVDYANLAADIATFPVIMNRLGLLLTDMENRVSEAELNLRIWQAKKREEIRNTMINDKNEKLKPTGDITDDKMRMAPMYAVLYKRLHKAIKQKGYIDKIYWSAKSKNDNLNKLSLTIQIGDIDIENMTNTFNGMKLRTFKKLLK